MNELCNQIEQKIRFKTHGQVRRVCVEFQDQAIVLHGRANTYYAKQLAQHAVAELFCDRLLVNAIQVG